LRPCVGFPDDAGLRSMAAPRPGRINLSVIKLSVNDDRAS
jgi:hypothetical protein